MGAWHHAKCVAAVAIRVVSVLGLVALFGGVLLVLAVAIYQSVAREGLLTILEPVAIVLGMAVAAAAFICLSQWAWDFRCRKAPPLPRAVFTHTRSRNVEWGP